MDILALVPLHLVHPKCIKFLNLPNDDLMSLDSVRACATEFLSKSEVLNIFIANAAVMACPEGKTNDGFKTQLAVNHLENFFSSTFSGPASSDLPKHSSLPVLFSSAPVLTAWGSRDLEI